MVTTNFFKACKFKILNTGNYIVNLNNDTMESHIKKYTKQEKISHNNIL